MTVSDGITLVAFISAVGTILGILSRYATKSYVDSLVNTKSQLIEGEIKGVKEVLQTQLNNVEKLMDKMEKDSINARKSFEKKLDDIIKEIKERRPSR